MNVYALDQRCPTLKKMATNVATEELLSPHFS